MSSDQRAKQIEQVAARLFFAKGYDASSMREIARAVGIQPASLYHHFPAKQDLLYAVIDHMLDDMLTRATEGVDSSDEAGDRLRALVRAFVLYLTEREREGIVGDIELRSVDPEHRAALLVKRDAFQKLFEDVVAEGVSEGAFSTTDPKLSVFIIIGMCNHVSLWYRPDGPHTPEEIADFFADTALAMLTKVSESPALLDA